MRCSDELQRRSASIVNSPQVTVDHRLRLSRLARTATSHDSGGGPRAATSYLSGIRPFPSSAKTSRCRYRPRHEQRTTAPCML